MKYVYCGCFYPTWRIGWATPEGFFFRCLAAAVSEAGQTRRPFSFTLSKPGCCYWLGSCAARRGSLTRSNLILYLCTIMYLKTVIWQRNASEWAVIWLKVVLCIFCGASGNLQEIKPVRQLDWTSQRDATNNRFRDLLKFIIGSTIFLDIKTCKKTTKLNSWMGTCKLNLEESSFFLVGMKVIFVNCWWFKETNSSY